MKAIISGGGTGGHIFPAIAIANALKKAAPDIDILFVGALGRMEMEKVPAAGYPIIGLAISGFQRRLTWKNLVFPQMKGKLYLTYKELNNDFLPIFQSVLDSMVPRGDLQSSPVPSIHYP